MGGRGCHTSSWRRRLPPQLQSTLDSVFFYNKTSISLKGVHVCLGPPNPSEGRLEPTVRSHFWCPPGRGVFQEHLGSIMTDSWVVWRPGPGMSVLRGAVLHCPTWASPSPPEKWEQVPHSPEGGWEEGGKRPWTQQEHVRSQDLRAGQGPLLPPPCWGWGWRTLRFHNGSFRVQPHSLTSMSPSSAAV